MDKYILHMELQGIIDRQYGGFGDDKTIFLKLLQQVWQIDWTVAPYDVWSHYIELDVPYFLRFMEMDEGDREDENSERDLLNSWVFSKAEIEMQERYRDANYKRSIMELIDEVNLLRSRLQQNT